ncbi:hypothetical protein SBA1_730036 [Candidatus Sulfotelmatobacter kueseliae]|uniref:Uncharacterized protein n=1 Tax=Candidatus Sulfotelmatobacter kueseliae TaxID=2042962 RepID=A0A2U3L5Y4_9BACT|nr:hypothetical protein SBA1_730036 [Candidatus Sulfotelmatobacter kueseliae]
MSTRTNKTGLIPCVYCGKTGAQFERTVKEQTPLAMDWLYHSVCCEGPYDVILPPWTCSWALIWRSLPSGEDR